MPIEAYRRVHGEGESKREVTAVLYTGKRLSDAYQVAQELQREGLAQAVFWGQVFAQVRDFFLQWHAAYRALFLLILLLAPLLVWQGVYAGGLERRRNTALLRALGAPRGLVFAVVPWETGGGGGLGLGAGLLGARPGLFLLPLGLLSARTLISPHGMPAVGLCERPFGAPALAYARAGHLAALPPALRQSPLEFL